MIFYAEHSCDVCADAEVELQSSGYNYKKYFVTAASQPGFILIWNGGESTMVHRTTIPYVPALYDKKRNFLICGLEGIINYLRGGHD
tara:strand:- start:834 stop:1094 length:261 start_codon:yes stop_codon:yes gene_type:complete